MWNQTNLEFAAKAAGIGPILCYERKRDCLRIGTRKEYRLWNPLHNYEDAMLLALACEMTLDCRYSCAMPKNVKRWENVEDGHSQYSDECDIRVAIVRCAAKIGREMP